MNKKLIIIGILSLAGVGYYFYNKKLINTWTSNYFYNKKLSHKGQHIWYNKAYALLYQKVEQSQHFYYISIRDIIKSWKKK